MTQPIIVVSGLPRSGTSMMMRMLEAGGVSVLTDRIRQADDDNPKGYYEFERVKQIAQDTSWLAGAQGRAVKIISALLPQLPPTYTYKIVFMQREMQEILDSQRRMLLHRGEPTDKVDDRELALLFEKHLGHIQAWLAQQPNISVLYVSYNAVLEDPIRHARQIADFLGLRLDIDRMARAVDHSLYRQRHRSAAAGAQSDAGADR